MIAIIDDDSAVRSATGAMLRSLGYLTAGYDSAEAFLASDGLTTVSCIISDVKMPGMSGIELQQRLAEQGRRLPIIFMTAFPEERDKGRAMKAGALGFLVKPFAQDVLIDCLNSALQV